MYIKRRHKILPAGNCTTPKIILDIWCEILLSVSAIICSIYASIALCPLSCWSALIPKIKKISSIILL